MGLKYKISLGFGVLVFLANISCYAYEYNGLNINGFISQGYLYANHNDYLADTKGGTFDFNEMGLNFGYQLNDSFLFALRSRQTRPSERRGRHPDRGEDNPNGKGVFGNEGV